VVGLCLALLLSGCMLVSGEQTTTDAQPSGGNVNTTFVSAEGEQERMLETGASRSVMNVIVIIAVQQGELRLEVLDPGGAVALAVQGRPDEQVTKSGNVATDQQGVLRYRVVARGARNGGFQMLYQPAGQ
jgi:starvation-inducible outer membrane lipoprotein